MDSTKIEFAVQIRKNDKSDVDKLREALDGLGHVEIDAIEGRVIVQTTFPWSQVQDKIESSGRRAVLSGFGGESAVALVNTTGCVVDRTPVQGAVRFTTITAKQAGVVVDGVVDGLAPGLHGFHIHESGDVSEGCASVGEHYNPRKSPHGSPDAAENKRHAGDLGNIRADDTGRATFRFVDSGLEIWDIIGRAVVITANADDLGCGDNKQSLIDGNSGERIACGIIARSAGILQNFKRICACDGVTLWDERNKPLAGKGRSQKL
ncbi:copper chaperone for superoxide dismutase [Drosophila grimshawi]|uniref:copper chaperone for superoxide dismutase n=1 Tax=Drosophila grimshawi TaxID=7222 RepID=UPI000C86FC0F|nr:copper chaperone for superoxide dismutase [Drosophila grimshawi]